MELFRLFEVVVWFGRTYYFKILSPNNLENYLYKFGFENLISSYDLNIIIFFFILFVLAFTFRSVFSYFIASKIIKEGTEIQKHLD